MEKVARSRAETPDCHFWSEKYSIVIKKDGIRPVLAQIVEISFALWTP
jgi:hypothetical protein